MGKKAKDLQFGNELVEILDIYTENGFSDGEPLDSDSVDNLSKIIKAQLELLNGNITEKEYSDMLEPEKTLIPTNKVYITSVSNKQDSTVVKYALLLANDELVSKLNKITKISKEIYNDIINDDLDTTLNFFMVANELLPQNLLTDKLLNAINKAIAETGGDWFDCVETDLTPEDFNALLTGSYDRTDRTDLRGAYNWNDDSKIIVTADGFYLIEETETNYFESCMVSLSDITE